MISAKKPANENERLSALKRFEILDTDPEQVFDDLTALASEICGTPIALVSLIDADRQWFKSKVGIDAPETPRDLAFCAHAILGDEIFEVEDASKDERFHDNPLVAQAPDIRFYAGVPLRTSEGQALGTLCVIDQKAGKLTPLQRHTLEVLGRQVIAQMELRLAARRALDLSQAKSRFLASMSHELRTPLNAILGFSGILKKKDLDPKAEKFVESIHGSGQRLLEMINDILDLSKIEAGKIELRLKPTDLVEMGHSLVDEMKVLAQPGVELQIEAPDSCLSFETDSGRLRQVLVNLVGNALKFTEKGSVKVGVEVDSSGQPLMIRVYDTGTGMTEDQLDSAFRPFEQVDKDERRSLKGTGLGLALARQLSNELGFKLTATSEPNKGSVFTVVL